MDMNEKNKAQIEAVLADHDKRLQNFLELEKIKSRMEERKRIRKEKKEARKNQK